MRIPRHLLLESATNPRVIRSKVYEALEIYSDIPKSKIKDNHHLVKDLGLDSLGEVEVVIYLEEELNIEIQENQMPQTDLTVKQMIDIVTKVSQAYNQRGSQFATKVALNLTKRLK